MSRAGDAAAAFDAAFIARARGHAIRPQTDADRDFLTNLFAAVSPLHDMLPPPLLAQQAQAANAHFDLAFPTAMRRIVLQDQTPVGRIIVDWTPTDHAMGVDIAVMPQAKGVGLTMLRAWLATADALAVPCRLTVVKANPARAIYARLGFRAAVTDPGDPMLAMVRPVTAVSPGRRPSRSDGC